MSILSRRASSRGSTDNWLAASPEEDDFYVAGEVWQQLCYAVAHAQPLLLIGPTGCGKTEVAMRVAEAMGRCCEAFNFGAMTEPRSSLIGVTHLSQGQGTRFSPSRFATVFQRPGAVIILDEVSRAGRDAFNLLLPVLDHQAYLALDESETGEVVRRGEGVTFLATANVGLGYTGADELDLALLDRMQVVVRLDYPSEAQETAILVRRCPGLKTSAARRLTKLAAHQRRLAAEGEFVGAVSTRALLAAGQQIAVGVEFDNAVRYCVVNRFSNEGGPHSEQEKLLQVIQKHAD